MINHSSVKLVLITAVCFFFIGYVSHCLRHTFKSHSEELNIEQTTNKESETHSFNHLEDHSIKVEEETVTTLRGTVKQKKTVIYSDIRDAKESIATKSVITHLEVEKKIEDKEVPYQSQYALEIFTYLPFKPLFIDRKIISLSYGVNCSMRIFSGFWATAVVMPQDYAGGIGLRMEF